MAIPFLSRPELFAGADFKQTEALNMRLHSLASAPTSPSPVGGQTYYNSVTGLANYYDAVGEAWAVIKDTWVASVSAGTAITIGGTSANPTVNVQASSGSQVGTMSAAHYTLVNDATSADVGSTLVKRDAGGNFAADTITADLTGNATTATTATLLSGSRTINGTVFDNSGNITITAAAGTLTGNTLNSGVTLSSLTTLGAQAEALDMNSQKITGLADGTAVGDAVNLGQLQSAQAGLDVKGSVRAATTANITLSGAQTIDGVSVVAGERVLVKNQTTGSQNGIYVAATGAWSRSDDADTSAEVTSGCFVFVSEGSLASTGWVLTTADPIVLGTTSLSFTQFNSASGVVAGDGILVSGSTVSAVGTANRISVSGSGIDISSAYVGQASITTLGTVLIGTWAAGTINGITVSSSSGTLNMATFNLTLSANATVGGTHSGTSSGSNTGDQAISITGDGTASGSVGVLTLAVTKINNVSLAGLATGILKNTTATGQPSIAVAADFPTLNQDTTGNATTATTASFLSGSRTINGTIFNNDGNITIAAAAGTLTGTTINSSVVNSSLNTFGTAMVLGTPASGDLTNCTFPAFNQNTTGSAATLSPGATINGVNFTGATNITVTADASTLTGSTLNASITSSSLTSVGIITSGTWTGTTIAVANGGTGATTAAGARTNLVAVTRFAATLTGDSTTADFTVTHNFNTRDVIVSVVQSSAPYAVVMTDVVATTADAVHVVFATAPATGTDYRVVIAALSA